MAGPDEGSAIFHPKRNTADFRLRHDSVPQTFLTHIGVVHTASPLSSKARTYI